MYRHWAIELGSFGSEKLLILADNMLLVYGKPKGKSWQLTTLI